MFCATAASGGPHEERLIDDIIRNRNYTPLARPVAEESDAVIVSFGLSLQQIIRVVSRTLPLFIQHGITICTPSGIDSDSLKPITEKLIYRNVLGYVRLIYM